MIRIETDAKIEFAVDDSPLNPTQTINPAAQARLLEALGKYLESRGLERAVVLGGTGYDNERSNTLSIMEIDGYWIVATNERGESRFLGLFFSFMDAVKFLLMKATGDDQCNDFPWSSVFV